MQWLSKFVFWELFGLILIAGAVVVGVLLVIGWITHGRKLKVGKDGVSLDDDFPAGGISNAPHSPELTQHLEVRDYRHILVEAFKGIKDDIRYRVRKNGWEQKTAKEWADYVSAAIRRHDLDLTKVLDERYYPQSRIERTSLYDWNQTIAKQVEEEYAGMYNRLLATFRKGHGILGEKRKELDSLTKFRDKECAPTIRGRCPGVDDVIRLTTELVVGESLTTRENCMVEAERALDQILQMYYSHYLARFKQISEPPKK